MSNNIELEGICFADLIKTGRIRVPKIQRDYAQGRENHIVDEIRRQFVRSLMQVVNGKRSDTQLDFVYGSDRNDAFEPLDGQQRLTTLFLLHWILGYDLKASDGKALLTYETRNTSEAFCNELVIKDPQKILAEARAKKTKPSVIIKKRDWFQWSWNYDPTVQSMLVMIDAFASEIPEKANLDVCRKRLDNIRFNHLDLGDMGMSDELFIKMNARGKQLSDFDKLKSTIEEEIQIQQKETGQDATPLADKKTETEWRSRMDHEWIDFFWQKYAGKVMEESPDTDETKKRQLKAAQTVEFQMKKFILRMIAMQFFEAYVNDPDLRYAAYNVNEDRLDDLLTLYSDTLIDWRGNNETALPAGSVAINFARLISDIDALIYAREPGIFTDVTSDLPRTSGPSGYEAATWFEQFLSPVLANDCYVVFYAIVRYLRLFPRPSGDAAVWTVNFNEWVKFVRNLFLNVNNNQRIDKMSLTHEAFEGVKMLAAAFAEYLKDAENDDANVATNPLAVLNYIQWLSQNRDKVRHVDPRGLLEEFNKASLRLANDDWSGTILAAEKIPYLWGQIRSLIHWSNGSPKKLAEYASRMDALLSATITTKEQCHLLNGLLAVLPDYGFDKDAGCQRLYCYNNDRDNSFKRYLRNDEHGEAFRLLIDRWLKDAPGASFLDFATKLVANAKHRGWQGLLMEHPDIYWWSNSSTSRKVHKVEGHPVLLEVKTLDGHYRDLAILYLRLKAESIFGTTSNWYDGNNDICHVSFHDSKIAPTHQLEITTAESSMLVRWGDTPGTYVIEHNGVSAHYADIDTVVPAALTIMRNMAEK